MVPVLVKLIQHCLCPKITRSRFVAEVSLIKKFVFCLSYFACNWRALQLTKEIYRKNNEDTKRIKSLWQCPPKLKLSQISGKSLLKLHSMLQSNTHYMITYWYHIDYTYIEQLALTVVHQHKKMSIHMKHTYAGKVHVKEY